MKPEERARVKIDEKLRAAGWVVQDLKEANLTANRGVAPGARERAIEQLGAGGLLWGETLRY